MLLKVVLASALVSLLPATAHGACAKDTFPCNDGSCVRREEWCDGKENCEDGSDEAQCRPKWWGISPNDCKKGIHFRCDDGLCWPLAARCDGTADCKDKSDEVGCDSEVKEPKEPGEIAGPVDVEEKPEEVEDKSKESSEEEIFPPQESSEETISLKESSEEDGTDETTPTTETPSATETSIDFDLDDYDYTEEELSPETTTAKLIPPPSIDSFFTLATSTPEVSSRPPTTEMSFYAKKMEQSEVKKQYSTQSSTRPTRAYRPPAVRPVSPYPTSRKPAVPYIGPTRRYTPRPYRYIGAQYSGQTPTQYRGRYYQSPHAQRISYQSPNNNYISSQPRTNHRQQYPHLNNGNARSDWRNGVATLPRVYGRQLRAPSRFYFKKNYNEIYGRTNYPSVKRGVNWILGIRNATGGWGKETPRALVALSLVNNSFLTGSYENDLMQKYFQVHLGVNLLRDDRVSLNRLAMLVNALIATCQNPRDFQGWDLTELIRNIILKLHRVPKPPLINPLVYLSLCLADSNLTHYEVHHLMTYLVANRNDEVTRDMTSLALEAFACHMQKERRHNVAQFYTLQKMVWNVTSKILQRLKEDGSFGSVYSTALAAKALMSVNDSVEWNPEPTFRFLKSHQLRDGSFGDFLSTYHALPALSGRSLLHLRNTDCHPPRVDRELSPEEILQYPGPKSYIRYSLHLGNPLATGYTVQVLVPTGISFYDVMRVAAYENDRFKFSYEEVSGKISVYSISDIPNDAEEGVAWRLYVTSLSDNGNTPNIQQLYTGDIRELLPTPDQHIIFWYHTL